MVIIPSRCIGFPQPIQALSAGGNGAVLAHAINAAGYAAGNKAFSIGRVLERRLAQVEVEGIAVGLTRRQHKAIKEPIWRRATGAIALSSCASQRRFNQEEIGEEMRI